MIKLKYIFCIILFITFALRPVIEISNVLYYQLNIETIIEKYCVNKERPQLRCNGKCFLTKRIQQQTTETETADGLIQITEAFVPLFFQENHIDFNHNKYTITATTKESWISIHFYKNHTIAPIAPPPKDNFI